MKNITAFLTYLCLLSLVMHTSCDPAFGTQVYLVNKTGNTIYLKNTARKGVVKIGLGSGGIVDTPTVRNGNIYAHLPALIKPDSSRLIYYFSRWGVPSGARISDIAKIRADSIVISYGGKDLLLELYDSVRCTQNVVKGENCVAVYRMIGTNELK